MELLVMDLFAPQTGIVVRAVVAISLTEAGACLASLIQSLQELGLANGYGTIADGGYNISSDGSISFSETTSRKNLDPRLQPLASNGGPTQTMPITSTSPAVDKIPADVAVPLTDQRGISRPQGPASDIGAYELSRVPPIVTGVAVATNVFAFVYNSATNTTYIVQFKTNLNQTVWFPLITNIGTGGPITNRDSTTNSSSRFYRVLVQ